MPKTKKSKAKRPLKGARANPSRKDVKLVAVLCAGPAPDKGCAERRFLFAPPVRTKYRAWLRSNGWAELIVRADGKVAKAPICPKCLQAFSSPEAMLGK